MEPDLKKLVAQLLENYNNLAELEFYLEALPPSLRNTAAFYQELLYQAKQKQALDKLKNIITDPINITAFVNALDNSAAIMPEEIEHLISELPLKTQAQIFLRLTSKAAAPSHQWFSKPNLNDILAKELLENQPSKATLKKFFSHADFKQKKSLIDTNVGKSLLSSGYPLATTSTGKKIIRAFFYKDKRLSTEEDRFFQAHRYLLSEKQKVRLIALKLSADSATSNLEAIATTIKSISNFKIKLRVFQEILGDWQVKNLEYRLKLAVSFAEFTAEEKTKILAAMNNNNQGIYALSILQLYAFYITSDNNHLSQNPKVVEKNALDFVKSLLSNEQSLSLVTNWLALENTKQPPSTSLIKFLTKILQASPSLSAEKTKALLKAIVGEKGKGCATLVAILNTLESSPSQPNKKFIELLAHLDSQDKATVISKLCNEDNNIFTRIDPKSLSVILKELAKNNEKELLFKVLNHKLSALIGQGSMDINDWLPIAEFKSYYGSLQTEMITILKTLFEGSIAVRTHIRWLLDLLNKDAAVFVSVYKQFNDTVKNNIFQELLRNPNAAIQFTQAIQTQEEAKKTVYTLENLLLLLGKLTDTPEKSLVNMAINMIHYLKIGEPGNLLLPEEAQSKLVPALSGAYSSVTTLIKIISPTKRLAYIEQYLHNSPEKCEALLKAEAEFASKNPSKNSHIMKKYKEIINNIPDAETLRKIAKNAPSITFFLTKKNHNLLFPQKIPAPSNPFATRLKT